MTIVLLEGDESIPIPLDNALDGETMASFVLDAKAAAVIAAAVMFLNAAVAFVANPCGGDTTIPKGINTDPAIDAMPFGAEEVAGPEL